jgi:hypothetical protein
MHRNNADSLGSWLSTMLSSCLVILPLGSLSHRRERGRDDVCCGGRGGVTMQRNNADSLGSWLSTMLSSCLVILPPGWRQSQLGRLSHRRERGRVDVCCGGRGCVAMQRNNADSLGSWLSTMLSSCLVILPLGWRDSWAGYLTGESAAEMMYGSDMTMAVCCWALASDWQKSSCFPRAELQGVPGGSSID